MVCMLISWTPLSHCVKKMDFKIYRLLSVCLSAIVTGLLVGMPVACYHVTSEQFGSKIGVQFKLFIVVFIFVSFVSNMLLYLNNKAIGSSLENIFKHIVLSLIVGVISYFIIYTTFSAYIRHFKTQMDTDRTHLVQPKVQPKEQPEMVKRKAPRKTGGK